jgi:uncharacterized membrane protein
MPTDERHEELLRLIATLTERVYKLEQAVGMRPAEPEPPSGHGSEASRMAPLPAVPKAPLSAESGAELESRIGGQWLNRLGILAVLIGVSYFLKYAFDNDWVGPSGRVVIGLAGGLAVVFWSERVRRNGYPVFSYSLKAVGIGILYLSLWASSQLYQLIPAGLAFGAMAAVTAATAALALSQDAQVIAAFAAIGGFMTPIALSTGRNNLAGLFAYTTLLDLGALALLRYRPWIRVMLGSYVGTLILYAFWHDGYYTGDQFAVTFAWVSSVFAVFALAPFVDRHGRDVNAILLLALANAATYSFEAWELLDHAGRSRQASAAAVVFGCLFFFMATQLRRRAPAVTTEVHWTIGAALLIVAVPLGFDVPWITIGWFIEGAAIIGVSYRTGNRYLRHLGAITLASGVVRLLAIDNFEVARLIVNERFLTSAVAVAALCYVARTAAVRGTLKNGALLVFSL